MADSEIFYPSKYAARLNMHGTLPAQANVKYPPGTMVARDANGRASRPAAGLPIAGVSEGEFDNTASGPLGVAGANDAINVELSIGVHTFKYTGTAPKQGEIVYAVDNVTVQLTPSTLGIAGVVTENSSGGVCAVLIDPVLNSVMKALFAAAAA